MIRKIVGLHHVTAMASDPAANNSFFTKALGLRRVKKTVNFDAPDVYHLYYGDETGAPGTIMTYFPFPDAAPGRKGAGEVGATVFAVPEGALGYWAERLQRFGVQELAEAQRFGAKRLTFAGPDGDELAIVEDPADTRAGWANETPADSAIRGFHSASIRLRDIGATAELLKFMGYEQTETEQNIARFRAPGDAGAQLIDLEAVADARHNELGAGSVHHIAFAVPDRAAQLEVRQQLLDTGYQVTPVIDRDYFWAIYFRTPGGVLFEIATNEPGFDRDEDVAHLGEALKLPTQHAHLRPFLEKHLKPLGGGVTRRDSSGKSYPS
ncbi:MAG: VOC family protein [Neomegalonema sp.]|nr:VOC family protein [Neomegalonema sp.]